MPPRLSCFSCCALLLGLPLAAAAQQADMPPAFDRPGIGLGTGIVPRGALALELGLPSVTRDRDPDGLRTRLTQADATLRTGLAAHWELQVSSSPWQHLRSRGPGQPATTARGSGDSIVGLKWAPAREDAEDRWALLATTTLARGNADFSEGRLSTLAATYEHDLGEHWTGALYASASGGGGQRSVTWSPSLSWAASDRVSAFVEAGFTRNRGEPDENIAGAGVTWMATPRIQLDASFDLGLDRDSPDLQAGLGMAIYFGPG